MPRPETPPASGSAPAAAGDADTPSDDAIRIEFKSDSEILVRMPKERKSASEKRWDRLTHPIILPLVTAALLALGGTAWTWGSGLIQTSNANAQQAHKLSIELQDRTRKARNVVENMAMRVKESKEQKQYFGNAGQTDITEALGWLATPATYRARFPEFDQRSMLSLLQELQLVACADRQKSVGDAERALTNMLRDMRGKGLDAAAMNHRLQRAENLIGPPQ